MLRVANLKSHHLSNEDVQRCGCNGYALTEIVQSSGPDLYMVGNMDVTQQAFNRTANNGLARGAKTSTPWIWLGGVSCQDIAAVWVAFFSRWQRYRCRQGYRQDIATDGGFVMDFTWDYLLYNSWSLGKQINEPYYGQHAARFARWDLVEHAVFWPPPAGVNPSKVTVPRQPGGEPCNVALGHFIAYCWGAAGIAHDFGRHSCAP